MSKDLRELGEVCQIIAGQHIEAALYTDSPVGSPYLTGPADFGDKRPVITKWTDCPKVFAADGDVLVTVKGNGVGKINLGCNAAIGRQLMALRPRVGQLDQSYLFHCLGDAEARIFARAQGATVPGIGKDDLASLRLFLPTLLEQQRIADVLDRAEALRAKRRAALAQLDTLTQAIFVEMFGNPITNERRWPITQLGNLAQIERGKFTPRPRNDPSYYGGRFPFIQTGDISNSGGRVTSWSQTLNDKGIAVSRSFKPGTVVIAIVGATLGITATLDVEIYCPDSVVGIEAHPTKACAEYIERVLRFWRPIFVAQAPETARANINLETLRPLQVPSPPVQHQCEFARRVAAVEQLRSAHRASLVQMDELFASLQHRAFRGEL